MSKEGPVPVIFSHMGKGKIAYIAASCLIVGGCFGGCEEDEPSRPPPPTVTVEGSWPCVAQPGQRVTFYGTNLSAVQSVRGALGMNYRVVMSTGTSLTVEIPAGAQSGTVTFSDFFFRTVAFADMTVGAETVVPEAEPNDDINGADATPMGLNREASGTLATVSDRDHFRRDCFHAGSSYTVRVSPSVVGTVFIQGVAVNLDGSGTGTFTATGASQVIGLTGGTGNYTITFGLNSW